MVSACRHREVGEGEEAEEVVVVAAVGFADSCTAGRPTRRIVKKNTIVREYYVALSHPVFVGTTNEGSNHVVIFFTKASAASGCPWRMLRSNILLILWRLGVRPFRMSSSIFWSRASVLSAWILLRISSRSVDNGVQCTRAWSGPSNSLHRGQRAGSAQSQRNPEEK